MGKGKGALEHYVVVIKPGRIIFEMGGVPESLAVSALRLGASNSLSVNMKPVSLPFSFMMTNS